MHTHHHHLIIIRFAKQTFVTCWGIVYYPFSVSFSPGGKNLLLLHKIQRSKGFI